jgi:DNA-directed RNA polymerase subunit RPC12/RpoP
MKYIFKCDICDIKFYNNGQKILWDRDTQYILCPKCGRVSYKIK